MLKKYTAATLIGWGQLISGVALIIWRNPFTPAGHWDMSGYLAFAYLLLGATIASYAFYLSGLKLVGPTKASLISVPYFGFYYLRSFAAEHKIGNG